MAVLVYVIASKTRPNVYRPSASKLRNGKGQDSCRGYQNVIQR